MNTEAAQKTIRTVTLTGLVGNLFLTAAKFIVGVLCYSQTLIADGVHSLSDLATDLIVLIGVRFWSAPPDADHPYGHGRIETIVTVVIGVALAAAGGSIAWDALSRMEDKTIHKPELAALIVALVSIVLKEWLYRWTARKAREVESSAMAANAWHHRSDAISSIPAAIAIGISFFVPGWAFVDKVGAVLVSCFILHTAWVIIRKPLYELSDAGAPAVVKAIADLAVSVPGAVSVHAVRTRSTGQNLFVDLHLFVKPTLTVREGHDISTRVKRTLLQSNYHIQDVVVHIEPAEERHSDDDLDTPSASGK